MLETFLLLLRAKKNPHCKVGLVVFRRGVGKQKSQWEAEMLYQR